MQITADHFKENARHALDDPQLQRALNHVRHNFIDKRAAAVAALPEFERLREDAAPIKNHALDHLDLYLEAYEARVAPPAAMCISPRPPRTRATIILDICQRVGAKSVTKGKSMISEEIG